MPRLPIDEILVGDTELVPFARELRSEIAGLLGLQHLGPLLAIPVGPLPAQWKRRLVIRSFFSYIEAVSFAIRLGILRTERLVNELPPEFVSVAREENFAIEESGQLRPTSVNASSLSWMQFSFKLHALAYHLDFELDRASNGWKYLKASSNLRNLLTHPRTIQSLQVSDQDFTNCLKACIWFERQVDQLNVETALALYNILTSRGVDAPAPEFAIRLSFEDVE